MNNSLFNPKQHVDGNQKWMKFNFYIAASQ